MNALSSKSTVGEWVTDQPWRSRTLERLGIDYCCGGKQSLDVACRQLGLDPEQVLAVLRKPAGDESTEDVDWRQRSLTALCGHIESTHHAFLREELPRLAALCRKVASAHGARHPEFVDLERDFGPFHAELEAHMLKEERVLFPAIRTLESGDGELAFHCGDLSAPLQVMELEHDAAGEALRRFSALTHCYRAPADACGSTLALLDGLATLEADLHLHIHKENNILFPRTRSLMGSGAVDGPGREGVRCPGGDPDAAPR